MAAKAVLLVAEPDDDDEDEIYSSELWSLRAGVSSAAGLTLASPLQGPGAAPSVPGAVGGEDPGVARGAPGHAQVSLGCFLRTSSFKQDIMASA